MNTSRGWAWALAMVAAAVLLPAGLGRANPGFIPSSRINCTGSVEDADIAETATEVKSDKNEVRAAVTTQTVRRQVLQVKIWQDAGPLAELKTGTCTIYHLADNGLRTKLSRAETRKLFVNESKKPNFGGAFAKDFVHIVEKGAPTGRYVLVVRQDDGAATGYFEFEID